MEYQKTLTTPQVAKIIGVTVKTIQRWDREGKLKSVGRTAGNHRLLTNLTF
jgi:putative resolvase